MSSSPTPIKIVLPAGEQLTIESKGLEGSFTIDFDGDGGYTIKVIASSKKPPPCLHINHMPGKIHAVDGGVASEYDIVCAECGEDVGYFAYGSIQYNVPQNSFK